MAATKKLKVPISFQKKRVRRLTDYYELGEELGRGGFGQVYRGICLATKAPVAIKTLSKWDGTGQTEKVMMERFHHPNIMKYDDFFDKGTRYCQIVMELCCKIDPASNIQEHQVKSYAAQIALALEHMHAMQVVYRDLKPSNTVVSASGILKLIDMGMAVVLVEGKAFGFRCTPSYAAPEMITSKFKGTAYSHQVDFWALGVYICEVLSGHNPFDGDNVGEIIRKVGVGIKAVNLPRCHGHALSLVHGLLKEDPWQRYGIQDVKVHPFNHGVSWEVGEVGRVDQDASYSPAVTEFSSKARQ